MDFACYGGRKLQQQDRNSKQQGCYHRQEKRNCKDHCESRKEILCSNSNRKIINKKQTGLPLGDPACFFCLILVLYWQKMYCFGTIYIKSEGKCGLCMLWREEAPTTRSQP